MADNGGVWRILRPLYLLHCGVRVLWVREDWHLGGGLGRQVVGLHQLYRLPVPLFLDLHEPLQVHDERARGPAKGD